MESKRIMVLGAGRGQVGLIKAIKRDGHKCIVTSIPGEYPGFDLADEICYADISNPIEIDKAVKDNHVDAVATCCLDTGISALGYACEQNGLIGLSTKSAKISGDKFLMKNAFAENGVNTAKYRKVTEISELKSVQSDLSFPMIVKAIDLQGSKGIYIAENESELYSAYEKTMRDTKKDFCIIEEFIVGDEFGAQAFVVNGKILYVMPTGDITYLSGTNVPVGHYVPIELDDKILAETREQVEMAIKAIGLNNCAVNIDLILKDGKVYVIELTGRVGANCLAELSSIYYGIDIYKMIYETALGKDVSDYFYDNSKNTKTPCYAKMLISEKSGKLKKIINKNNANADIYEITFFVREGDNVNKFTSSKDCLGQVIVKGNSLTEAKSFIDEVISNIEFVLE